MNTDTVRLNVTISKDLFATLSEHVGPRKKSQYISLAIRKQIELDQKQALDKELEEGYRASRNESLSISREYEMADLEHWDDY